MAGNHSLSEYLLRRCDLLKLVGWLAARNPSSVHPQYLWGNQRCPGAAGWCPQYSHSVLPRAGRPRCTPDTRGSDTASSAPWRSCACRREIWFDCMVFRAQWCTDASANSIFSCPITSTFNSMPFDGDPVTYQCQKEDKKGLQGFPVPHFYELFSNEIMVMKWWVYKGFWPISQSRHLALTVTGEREREQILYLRG